MEKFDNPPTQKEMQVLRDGLKKKYKTYNLLNRDRFPTFEYNTNRANYEPLRESFEEEFFVVRGLDTADRNIHIPSTNTLAQLFCDEHYLPGKKILNTCQAYIDELPWDTDVTNTLPASPRKITVPVKTVNLLLAGTVLVALLVVYFVSKPALDNAPPASGLTPQPAFQWAGRSHGVAGRRHCIECPNCVGCCPAQRVETILCTAAHESRR